MPFSTDRPVLHIDPATIASIDPQVPENTFGLWSAFSKCAGIMEEGRRFENLYWRVWNHRRLFSKQRKDPRSHASSLPTRQFSKRPEKVPELSSSVESASSHGSDDMVEPLTDSKCFAMDKDAPTVEPAASRRGEKHLSPIDLKVLVVSIRENQDPRQPLPELALPRPRQPLRSFTAASQEPSSATQDSTPRPSSPTPVRASHPTGMHESSSTVATSDSQCSPTDTASTSATSNLSAHNVVRGFLPGRESSYRSQTQLAPAPAPISILKASSSQGVPVKSKNRMFMVGSSSGEDEKSLDKHMVGPGRSSLSENLRRSLDSKKQTSFDETVTEIRVTSMRPEDNEAVFEDTDEENDTESAVEDDDEDAWENASDDGDSAPPSDAPESAFRRVDSKTNLVSRRSLLTAGLHEGDRKAALQNAASNSTPAIRRSRTSTPNGPSVAASPDEGSPLDARGAPIIHLPGPRVPPTSAAMSPRTTRRNMLMTEIPEDLRKDLLHERKQRQPKLLNGLLPRRHTSQELNNLPRCQPAADHGNSDTEQGRKMSENFYLHHGVGEYNVSGW